MDIPVPVPNTEVKRPYADDTPDRGKVGSCRLFFFILMISLPLAGGDFFCPPPACGLAASILRDPAWLHCPASCRACQAVPGAALLPLVPAAPALPAVFPGFRALVSSPGFRRAVPWLFPYSCSVWFQAGAFLSLVFRPNALSFPYCLPPHAMAARCVFRRFSFP